MDVLTHLFGGILTVLSPVHFLVLVIGLVLTFAGMIAALVLS